LHGDRLSMSPEFEAQFVQLEWSKSVQHAPRSLVRSRTGANCRPRTLELESRAGRSNKSTKELSLTPDGDGLRCRLGPRTTLRLLSPQVNAFRGERLLLAFRVSLVPGAWRLQAHFARDPHRVPNRGIAFDEEGEPRFRTHPMLSSWGS